MKHTKIVCTIGPASRDVKTICAMIEAGMNVARLNFSHGSHEDHAELIKNIREASEKMKIPIAIMQDLQGPKIRVSELAEPVEIKKGEKVIIGQHFGMDFDISGSVQPGQRILIEDGTIELKVAKVAGNNITCEVITSGVVRSHKGINLPDTRTTFPIMTAKDIRDLKFGLGQDVDYVALSFVRSKADIINIKKLITKYGAQGMESPRVIAKIERPEAIQGFDEILEVVDAIMVARGDLGVEIADAQVPLVQKAIIKKCLKAAVPVIVATQMLDSMIRNPRPTRAEVSDVANAVIDHADAVMLSGETAFGSYPVETVKEMRGIIDATEQSPYAESSFSNERTAHLVVDRASAIAQSVRLLAESIEAKAIIGTTESGRTARLISRQRSSFPIFILTDRPKVYRQLCLVWGIAPLCVKDLSKLKNIEGLLTHFITQTKRMKLVQAGDNVVLVAGRPLGSKMNMMEAVTVE